MKLPKYNGSIERSGVQEVGRLIQDELKWIFREQPTDDYGIDAHLEIVSEDKVTGRLIAIQIKTGESYFKEKNDEGYVFRGRIEHLNYWANYSLPVIIVLCDRQKGLCVWEHIDKSKVRSISEESWKITVPKTKLFGRDSIQELIRIAENKSGYDKRFTSLVLEKAWMEQIREGNKLLLEAEEWVNKTSGKGSVTLKVIDANTEEETIVLKWPMVFFPMVSYEDVFPKLFPWADFSIDEEYYQEYDEANIDEERYREDEDMYELKELLPKIRPYNTISGEVDCYRLVLTLNDLGKSFLLMDDYLQNGFKYRVLG